MSVIPITYYSRKEEIFNVISHLVGLILSMVSLTLLIIYSSRYGTAWHIVSFTIFGSSMVTLYLASTLYHATKNKELRRKLNVFDHASIYLLIAGTYTPYCLIPLNGITGWVLFGIVWGLALLGITFKIFLTGRYQVISTITYVLMGWIAVFAAPTLIKQVSTGGLLFLLIGGVSYTVGALFFSLTRLPFNHAVFHVFVLLGTASHFVSVFYFLL